MSTKRFLVVSVCVGLVTIGVGLTSTRLGDRMRWKMLQGGDLAIVICGIAASVGAAWSVNELWRDLANQQIEVQVPADNADNDGLARHYQHNAIAPQQFHAHAHEPSHLLEMKRLVLSTAKSSFEDVGGNANDQRYLNTLKVTTSLLLAFQGQNPYASNGTSDHTGSATPPTPAFNPAPQANAPASESAPAEPPAPTTQPHGTPTLSGLGDVWDEPSEADDEDDQLWERLPTAAAVPNSRNSGLLPTPQQGVPASNDRSHVTASGIHAGR